MEEGHFIQREKMSQGYEYFVGSAERKKVRETRARSTDDTQQGILR